MSKEGRYARQTLIPGWNQKKLNKSTVIIVGVGAIGSYVSTILASSGVKNLILIDFDTIEISNLNRQLLFRDGDIGKSKSEIAAMRLSELNPDINITFHHKKMQDLPISIYKKADVIVACLDTFIGRRWINSLAVKINKPLILGGMFAFLGDVQVVLPKKTACFDCQPLVAERELAQACTPFGEERKKNREEKEDEAKLPSVATLSAIIGGIMAQEALKLLLDIGEPIKNYLFYDGLHNATTIIELARRKKDCPTCGELYELEQVEFVVNKDNTVKELLIQLGLQFGLESPDIMIKGRILPHDSKIQELGIKNNMKVFVMDKNLASPIKLKLKIE
ncbi:MAG: ThiF family adenylyltransferase [Candidatus Heimdallarchaeum aukensis]|uniref:ThiF family adenylyltransferase n=1 Tax=Candidatus Heimdallarchaeum aukensis TaxID=2876573 RepID=A0A9Y1BII4_9ARCH|nr:MAG: ThiF family adenylyltransferase [Candidatus Heimdallarchaeum aukensis]